MALLQKSDFTDKILGQANIGLWAIELEDGRAPRMFADDTMLRLLGIDEAMSPEDTYAFWIDRIDPDYCTYVQDVVAREIRGENAEAHYFWNHPKRGAIYIRCGGMRNPEYTEFIRLEGSHQDITPMLALQERLEQQEESLLRSKRFSDYFLDSFLSAYYVNLEDGTFQVIRKSGGNLERYGHENFQEFIKNKAIDCISEDERVGILRQVTPENIRKRLQKGNEFSFVFRDIFCGETRHVKMRIIRGADDDHVAVGFEDVESLMRERQVLRDNRAKLREASLIASLADDYEFIGVVNTEKNEMTAYRMVPKIAEQVSDLGEDAADMERWMAFCDRSVVPSEAEHFYSHVAKARVEAELQSKPVYIFQTKMTVGGREGYYRFKFAQDKSNKARVIVGFRNVDQQVLNERKMVEMEKKLEYSKELERALAKAEEANRAKSTFLFNMSHDIRTPLNAIKGFSEMARKYIGEPERAVSCLDKVLESEKYLLCLIDDVLDLARIESGNIRIESAPFSLKAQGQYFDVLFAQEAAAKHIDYFHEHVAVQTDAVCGDKLHIEQVLINILNNAVKFTPGGGQIVLTTQQLDDLPDGRHCFCFTVRDTGIGMSPKFREHIFEQFSRERSSTESGVQGTGLGMAITKHLVELMDGKIEIESEVGCGTTVRVYLPLARCDALAAEEPDDAPADDSLAGRRVLVVEDNELNCEIAVDILQDAGLVVETAENGVIAVERLRLRGPGWFDFVLMDIQMPVMDGYEATRRIRRMPDGGETLPIIALSANAFEEDRQRSAEAGMNGHVAKPINVSELFAVLRSFL